MASLSTKNKALACTLRHGVFGQEQLGLKPNNLFAGKTLEKLGGK
jgi:hypothetical protein